MVNRGGISAAALVAFAGFFLAAQPTNAQAPFPPIGGPPAPMVSGDLSLGVGMWWFGGKSAGFLEADGRLDVPIVNGWDLMPEVYVIHPFEGDGRITGSLHLYKNLPNGAVGPFAALSSSGGGPTGFTLGLEGRADLPNAALTGQASHTGFGGYSVWQFGGWVDFYLSPETKITGGVEVGATPGDSALQASLKLTRHVPNSRLNFFGAAHLNTYSGGGGGGTAKVGATLNLGQIQNLRQQDVERPFRFRLLSDIGVAR